MSKCCTDFNQVKHQILATIVANVLCVCQGCGVGWLSPSLLILRSDESPLLSGKLTKSDAGWIGSMLSLGAILGTLGFGFLANRIGAKKAMMMTAIPITISWTIVLFAQYAWHLYVARLAIGLTGGGVYICIPLYVAEIAIDHIRGQLSSLMQVSFNSGILCGYILGTYLQYEIFPIVMYAFPAFYLCIFAFMPNTAQHLLKENKIEEAEKSLRFYRNCTMVSEDKEQKFQEEFERFKLIAKQSEATTAIKLSDFGEPEVVKGLMIGTILMAVSQFSGTFTISNYAATIFSKSGSTVDPNLSAIIFGCLQVLGTLCASSLIDKLGRKILLLVSTTGTAIGLVITGIYSYLGHEGYDISSFNLLPVISLSLIIFIAAIGVIPVPYVLVNEIFPRKIRKVAATMCTCTVNIFAFVMLRTFPIMLSRFHLYGCMWFFAAVSLFGLIFTIFAITETKGKNLDTIETNEV